MMVDGPTVGYGGIAISIVVLALLAMLNVFWWARLAVGKKPRTVRSGLDAILAGIMLLLLECSIELVNGKIWYQGLIPISWSRADGKISASYSLLAYVLIVLGVTLPRIRSRR